ncbi:hypothetical protein ABAC460_04980 [Asticcacaulis sp. AC460]|uniref:M23 family metallopeptidase n=1 Tax=Asticcacaulis sp. AC460 TaxID=1282360 RepID=UPI0003C3D9C8|nr:peptidoglycan DD-metalloendopeptidase family protein [Asticcacaulis sp. AC460]ESQ91695.1 hypothetical protein ABAC460_04980 [Asticcacaulis sp. AC460]
MKKTASLILLASLAALTACEPTGTGSTSSSSSATSSASETASASESSSSSESSIAMVDFPHNAAGDLIPGSGAGYTDVSNWAPGMCFPLAGAAYANSQVYNAGGSNGPSGGQCATANYSMPWRDNFCETRSWNNVVCSSGQGHQGQDIRPETCKANLHWAVATEDGVITQVGTYTVALTGNSSPHRIYRYLHLQSASLRVAMGDHVVRGQKIGLVSNNMGDTPTTIHLHFEIRVAQAETMSDGTLLAANSFVPPYTALVDAYQRKLAGPDCATVE